MIKGHIIDEHCSIKGELLESNGKVYSCILNQTDIHANSNKFYIMQAIKNGTTHNVYIRYGRISEIGNLSNRLFTSESEAKSFFEKQFKTKTGNMWGTVNFVKKQGKYFMSEVSYENEVKAVTIPANTPIPESKLHKKVQQLITMLSDINMMQQALVSLEIDTKKMPLGKINQVQLDKAGSVLNSIQTLLSQISTNPSNVNELTYQLVDLSSEYYTYLPMAFGRKKPPVIGNDDMLGKYRDVLDELRNIAVTIKIKENVKADENPIDGVYNDIRTNIKPLAKSNKIWKELNAFVANTHGPTHGCKLEVLEIFEVEQADKRAKFEKYCENIGNRQLLFHGTPQNCVLSIFKRDFYLDPSKINDVNVQIAGKMFGMGVYLADSSKSFGYTRAHATNNIGCFIVAEVALGNQQSKFNADYNITEKGLLKSGYNSVKGEGRWQPSSTTTINDIIIPNGPLTELHKNAALRYNEHIVYNVDQILIKYLIVLKNNGTYAGF